MEEEVKAKVKETKKSQKENSHKLMTALTDITIRNLIKKVNELEIKKDDIVSLFKEAGQFVLVYFK